MARSEAVDNRLNHHAKFFSRHKAAIISCKVYVSEAAYRCRLFYGETQMKKLMILAAAGFLALTPVVGAQAEDHAAGHAAPAAEATASAAVAHTLADGTKVEVEGDMVSVVAADGTKTPAPDGTHTLADGTTLTTAGGKVVTAPAAAE